MLRFPTISELKEVLKNKKIKILNFDNSFLSEYWTDKSRNCFDVSRIETYSFYDDEREERLKNWRYKTRLIFEKDNIIKFTEIDLPPMTWDKASDLINIFNRQLEEKDITIENANIIIKEWIQENQLLKN